MPKLTDIQREALSSYLKHQDKNKLLQELKGKELMFRFFFEGEDGLLRDDKDNIVEKEDGHKNIIFRRVVRGEDGRSYSSDGLSL